MRVSRELLMWSLACGMLWLAPLASAQTLTNEKLSAEIGSQGEIRSLTLANDAFPTNYVMNASNAPAQNTADHAWVGELMFSYRLGGGAFTTALTSQSGDVRKIAKEGSSVRVSYEGSKNAKGVRDFKLVETYTAEAEALRWSIEVTNRSAQPLEIGDLGLPLPFNEYWAAREVIYETRTVYHSFTGQNSSYISVTRPSGVGPFLLMLPDATTGAGFEYMDAWRPEEHPNSTWAAGNGWANGLDVFYIHSAVIKSTERGYLPSTSLTLAPGESKLYAIKFFKVEDQAAVKDRLYAEGLVDVSVVPGMIFATDMTARVDLRSKKPIQMLTAQYPSETEITQLKSAGDDHQLYALKLSHLGPNQIHVSYGDGEQTTLQFYAIEPVDAALARHATFMVEHTVSDDPSDPLYRIFDDWMMDTKSRRGRTGAWGWGDDWGWTKAQFLAEKNAQTPVASEVQALDAYLEAVWGTQINAQSYVVSDWFCTSSFNCFYDRAFAYPHVFNTLFSMYKVARLYPELIDYAHSADDYLMRAYNVLHTLYSGHGDPGTGYMGEQTLPDIIQALRDAGHASEAEFVTNVVSKLYEAFKSSPYPYGSEYNYDNTGEEAVYMAARMKGDTEVLRKVNAKTRACRGQEPVWYYYADPVTLNGENWWQFQYSVALIGYCMDDWLRHFSDTPELDERLSYAAKLGNLSAINSGQIDADPANLGTVAWTYQAMKGKVYMGNAEGGTLHNGWRQMSGEADLGLFGALRILSSDVAVDPLFGLYCYGCDVEPVGACYDIVPKDGVFKRLNLISQKLHVELERDRYSAATLGTDKKYVELTLQNQTGDAHTTKLALTGLAAGSYPVVLDGKAMGMLDAASDKPATLMLALGPEPTHTLQIGAACDRDAPMGPAGPGTTGGGGATAGGPGASGADAGTVVTMAGASDGGAGVAPSEAGTGSSAGQGLTPGAGATGEDDPGSSAGCGCRVAQSDAPPRRSLGVIVAALGLAFCARRRKRRAKRQLTP